MLKWFKINERNFLGNLVYQSHQLKPHDNQWNFGILFYSLTIEVSISNKSDYNYIMNLYYNRYAPPNEAMNKFDATCADFSARGCLLKSITKDPNKGSLTMEIVSDYIRNKEISERRDEIIDIILQQKQ